MGFPLSDRCDASESVAIVGCSYITATPPHPVLEQELLVPASHDVRLPHMQQSNSLVTTLVLSENVIDATKEACALRLTVDAAVVRAQETEMNENAVSAALQEAIL
eukprot:6262510-Amphidinium_carterae.1